MGVDYVIGDNRIAPDKRDELTAILKQEATALVNEELKAWPELYIQNMNGKWNLVENLAAK